MALRSWRQALLPFLATLQTGSDLSTGQMLVEADARAPSLAGLLRPGGPHTLPTRLTLLPELLPQAQSAAGARRLIERGREIAAELFETVGDGVLLHPAHPRVAPPARNDGRPPVAADAVGGLQPGLPVTEVPLGRSVEGLPLGVQAPAGPDRDRVSIAVARLLERAFGDWVSPGL